MSCECIQNAIKYADRLIKFLDVRPPVDLEYIAEYLNIDMLFTETPDSIAGALLRPRKRDRRCMILIDSCDDPEIQRYTTAHEIAHHIVLFDPEYEHFHKKPEHCRECFCEAFAMELLMPMEMIFRTLENIQRTTSRVDIPLLAACFGVTPDKMRLRLDSFLNGHECSRDRVEIRIG